ncbi:MAG: NFACT family protein [Treponemataceae bacterium]|nr:NFACT family protein [Treponemataceae bacterium]
MSLNCKEIDAVLQELTLEGTFIQQIVQPTFDSIAFYLYGQGESQTILVCLAPGACRLHATQKKIPRNDKPLRFMEFLRSKIKGARINSAKQLGQERIVKFELSHGEEFFNMYIRLWSNAANIIVTNPMEKNKDEKELILDVFFRRPKKDEITGGFYKPELKPIEDNTNNAKPQKIFEVRSFAELENSENLSFNRKVELWYTEHADSLSRASLLQQAEKQFNSKFSKLQNAIERLEAKRKIFLNAEQWKHQGDLLLTYGYLIEEASSKGQNFIECEDYDSGATVKISIDPKKKAQENAQVFYEKYKKAVSGLEELEYDIKASKSELAKLAADYEELKAEKNPIVIQQKLHKQNTPRQQIEKKHPGLDFVINGWHILVGRTAAENDELLRHHVKGQDWWLHARDWPGGYVFIKNQNGKSVPLDTLLDAGNLALFYSKGRKAGKGDLYYTQVKHLRRAKNAPKGTVLPSNEKNLSISLDKERLKRIETQQKNADGTLLL